jgi:SAM-dependent methyltransferase
MKYQTIVIVTVLVVLIYYLFINGNVTSIMHCMIKDDDSVPLSPYLLSVLSSQLTVIGDKYKFIDLGSGRGNVIFHFSPQFSQLLGVDIDNSMVVEARNKIKGCENIIFAHGDITTYEFEDVPTVFYTYEPFWTLNDETAIELYRNMFVNINKCMVRSKWFFVYVSAINSSKMSEDMLLGLGDIIYRKKHGSFLFNRMVYIISVGGDSQ